jgi:prolyl oligopeptidase PreP (S9A serine peptidase family)
MPANDPRRTIELPDDDPYLWLEEVEIARVLTWSRRNTRRYYRTSIRMRASSSTAMHSSCSSGKATTPPQGGKTHVDVEPG